jgi:CubicO group peptidase (beta-lactamase class C family)
VIQEDLEVEDLKFYKVINAQVDFAKQSASASLFGLVKRTAVYNPEMGCILVYGELPNATVSTRHPPHPNAVEVAAEVGRNKPAPAGISGKTTGQALEHFEVAKLKRLDSALEWAFAEPDPKHLRRTRAVVILRDGKIVAERYAEGFDQDMPLPGWSMAKSAVNALVGILVGQGKLDLSAPAPVPEWQGAGDPRREITLGQLMKMTSGLEFLEKASHPFSDVTKMLLTTPDAAAYAANKPLEAKPGTRWNYASGTTNIISRIIRAALGETCYLQFPRLALFEPLGMGSARFEADASGTFVGSSFLYASARDWAKFGQLYCQDGVWKGKRMLPEGWVSQSTTPAASGQQYGAHFWLVIQQENRLQSLPADAFHAIGYEGQCVSIIPSLQLVVVRLGLTRKASTWRQGFFLSLVIDALAGMP